MRTQGVRVWGGSLAKEKEEGERRERGSEEEQRMKMNTTELQQITHVDPKLMMAHHFCSLLKRECSLNVCELFVGYPGVLAWSLVHQEQPEDIPDDATQT